MAGSSLFALLDDITTVLSDAAVLAKSARGRLASNSIVQDA